MRKVRVGVYQSQFPYSSKCAYKNYPENRPYSCSHDPSLVSDILGAVAGNTDIHYEFIKSQEYGYQDENGMWQGTVGLIKNGSVDIAPDFWIRPERMNMNIRFSTPFFKVDRSFVCAQDTGPPAALNVFVYPPAFLAIVFATILSIGLLFTYVIRFNTKLSVWQAFEIFVFRMSSYQLEITKKYSFLFPGFLLIQIIYYGEFRGQTARSLNYPTVVKAKDFRPDLVAGNIRMIITTAMPMGLDKVLFGKSPITAKNEPILIDDIEEVARRLCDNPNRLIFYGDPLPLYGIQLPCPVKIYDFGADAAALNEVSFRSYVTYGFRQNLDQSLIDRINYVLLTLFNHDNVLNFWFTRYGLDLESLQMGVDYRLAQIMFVQIQACFLLYIVGMSSAIFVFVIEIMRTVSHRRTEARKGKGVENVVIKNVFQLPQVYYKRQYSYTDFSDC